MAVNLVDAKMDQTDQQSLNSRLCAFLEVSIRWMERGVFRGTLTPNPAVEKVSSNVFCLLSEVSHCDVRQPRSTSWMRHLRANLQKCWNAEMTQKLISGQLLGDDPQRRGVESGILPTQTPDQLVFLQACLASPGYDKTTIL